MLRSTLKESMMPTPKRSTKPSTPDPAATKQAQKESLSPPNLPKPEAKDEAAAEQVTAGGSSAPEGVPPEPHVAAENPIEAEPHNTDARETQAAAVQEVTEGGTEGQSQTAYPAATDPAATILYPYVPVTQAQALAAEIAAQPALALAVSGGLVSMNPTYTP